MDAQMATNLAHIGPKSDLVNVELILDDEDVDTQQRTRGGDRFALADEFTARNVGEWWVAAASHNIDRCTSQFTIWRNPS